MKTHMITAAALALIAFAGIALDPARLVTDQTLRRLLPNPVRIGPNKSRRRGYGHEPAVGRVTRNRCPPRSTASGEVMFDPDERARQSQPSAA